MSNYNVITTVYGQTVIQRLSDGAFIPVDLNNRDYAQYLKDTGH